MKKIGFDIHGVIDNNPAFFSELSKRIIKSGHEVHILTGSHVSPQLFEQLDDWCIHYTTVFSITDWADAHNLNEGLLESPEVDDIIWDSRKASYCGEHDIDILIDDTPEYGDYFNDKSKFMLYDIYDVNTPLSYISGVIDHIMDGSDDYLTLYKDKVRNNILQSEIYDLAADAWAQLTDNHLPTSMVDKLMDSIFDEMG